MPAANSACSVAVVGMKKIAVVIATLAGVTCAPAAEPVMRLALRAAAVESRFDALHGSGATELVGREESPVARVVTSYSDTAPDLSQAGAIAKRG